MFRFLLSVACFCLLYSCTKQKIADNTEMLSRPWTLHHYLENEADMTAHFDTVYADFTLNFYESGNFTQTYLYNGISPYSKTGTWKFLNVVNQIQLTDDVQSVIYNINTLTESTFDFEHTEGGILKQYVMISK